MRRQTTGSRAFTLVELLAVITIIVLLVSLLVPVLTSARELAKRAQCFANLHNITAAGLGFAAEHNGRGPGGGELGNPNLAGWGSSLAWCDSLNAEYYKAYVVPRGLWSTIDRPKGVLVCPNAKIFSDSSGPRLYTCIYQWSGDAAGGPNWDTSGNPPEGPYGLAVDTANIQSLYKVIEPHSDDVVSFLSLGARLINFPQPAYTYLMIESEHANPTFGGGWPYSNTVVNADLNLSLPPWGAGIGGPGDTYGFRHTLPGDFTAYQEKATACFAFVDGHVDVMNANVPDQNKYERFAFKP
jgi:prepilin-type N-terminal cleavage/methylation domain-containing protein